MSVYFIFISLFLFCIYVFLGLYMTEGLDTIYKIILGWIVYTILWITILNIVALGYFWSVIIKKTGPVGIRGPIGDMGKQGMDGACNINASKLYCMKELNMFINNLYKEKTNNDLLNEDTQTFPCNYLNEKIQTLAGSRQYDVVTADLSNDNKRIDNLINYLKSIWKIWFDLIYNATSVPGIWFTDEYADESGGSEFEWIGSNPFDEIKKYDIYYWGVTRDFRPLKAELCRSSASHGDSKFPKHQLPQSSDVQVHRLKVIETNDYYKTGDTRNAQHNNDGSWWSPKVQNILGETYYPVGDIMAKDNNDPTKTGQTIVGNGAWSGGGANGPDMKTIVVAGDVVDPIDYKFSADPYAYYATAKIWTPVCPDGYTSLGDVATSLIAPNVNQYKCIPTDCVEEIAPGPLHQDLGDDHPLSWRRTDRYMGWDLHWHRDYQDNIDVLNRWDTGDKDATYTNGYNLMRGSQSAIPGVRGTPWYKIKKSCMVKVPNRAFPPLPQIPPPSTKEVETLNANLGIGWYGHPYKLDPKYSIFTFLNLVPEGMIVNQGTGQRFYIVHVEGRNINLFNILTYNNNSGKFDGSLQINIYSKDDPNDAKIPNNKNYPNNSNLPNRVADPNEPTPEPVNFNPPAKRIIITTLDVTNRYQQWKIMLTANKKFFKIKNDYNDVYIVVTQESREGLVEFTSIDLNNVANDPAFSNIPQDELDLRTNFSFISSFGPQLDIIDKDDNNTTNR